MVGTFSTTTPIGWVSARNRSPISSRSVLSKILEAACVWPWSLAKRSILVLRISPPSAKSRKSNSARRSNRITEAVFGAPARLDRDLWLARLSDLILDGVQFPASANIRLSDWRRAIREGSCGIFLRGYSHVFVSGPNEAEEYSSLVPVPGVEDSYQEIFSRTKLRELVLKYFRDEDPMPIRRAAVDQDIWQAQAYRNVSERVSVIVARPTDPTKPPSDGGAPPPESPEPPPTPPGGAGGGQDPAPPRDASGGGSSEKWAHAGIDELISSPSSLGESPEDVTWLKQIESRTKTALQQFQLQAKLVTSTLTPNAALLKFAGSANLTVDQVLKRRTEFLTTHGLNLISIQPEPGVVALGIERPERRVLLTRELWGRWDPARNGGNHELLIAVREDDGQLLFLSPGKRHAPHTLIAGSTGSGKSVLMQNIILGIAATNTIDTARIVLIDPKQGVDYFQFEGLPHLEGGLIDRQERALECLQMLVTEMDDRYARLRGARVPNLSAFNQKVSPSERLPSLWLIHDEFAEWMLVEEYKEHVTAAVARLGVKARAAGIYLVFAAQRPDANVMPMQLRANLGNRLILRVDSEGTSEIALGEKGAERLLGRGHLLAKLEGEPTCYAQVPFVEDSFMEQVVTAIKSAQGRK